MPQERLFNDREHILYVNDAYHGDSELGKLMRDFNCTDADDMYFDLMTERTSYLKENPEGVKEMSKAMEEMIYEANYQQALEIAKRLITRGKDTLEEIAEDTGLTLNKVQELAASKSKA